MSLENRLWIPCPKYGENIYGKKCGKCGYDISK